MSRRAQQKELALDELLARGSVLRPLPDAVRARVLSRARATATTTPLRALDPIEPRRRSIAWAWGAAAALCVAAAAAALTLRQRPAPPVVGPVPGAQQPAHNEAPPAPVAPATSLNPVPSTPASSPAQHAAAKASASSGSAELDLLKRAHTAYASHEFGSALLLLAEHAHRFPRGVLSEQREALRVRSLAGAGRDGEARKAAAAFANRFPRSVLLPQIERIGAGKQ